MREIEVTAIPLEGLADYLAPGRAEQLAARAAEVGRLLEGRTVWNINSTATGGGVAEMLRTIVGYGRGAGIDVRWLVVDGDGRFFAITKRVHNRLHGFPGDGGPLGPEEQNYYAAVLAGNLGLARERIRPGDVVILHDPQTAGLVEELDRLGAHVVWRSHVGRDEADAFTDEAWAFLRSFMEGVPIAVFTRRRYAPSWLPEERIRVIPPSLDPQSAKNCPLSGEAVNALLRRADLLRNGLTGEDLMPHDASVVLQVSRWDRLKDMAGVLTGFAEHIDSMPGDAHLVLAGPDVSGVTDDPEGGEVLAECLELWRGLPRLTRARVHLRTLPMQDLTENALLVNGLQRHASVVVQKSLEEGFGLTVLEPLWKSRAVVASAVGGIQDQIEDGVSGLLLKDPTDLATFAQQVARVLHDRALGHRLGEEAHRRVQDRFLADRHLIQYGDLFQSLLDRPA